MLYMSISFVKLVASRHFLFISLPDPLFQGSLELEEKRLTLGGGLGGKFSFPFLGDL